MKAQPVPMSAMVMNSSAPFNLQKRQYKQEFNSELNSKEHTHIFPCSGITKDSRVQSTFEEGTGV